MKMQTGLDRLSARDPEVLRLLRGRVGLVAHPASIDAQLVHIADVLQNLDIKVSAYFGPEHGYGGQAQDMKTVDGEITKSGSPVYSLYGDTFESLSPKLEWLQNLDVLLIDLQDIGSRYYTFVWTACLAVHAAQKVGIRVVILDRPNPLNGITLEGGKIFEGYNSFVGLMNIPVRHGMTLAEIVSLYIEHHGLDAKLVDFVSMRGWTRSMYFDQTELPWVLPSPNMPTLDTALVYPGGCLLEGTLLSEGRGTTRPFELFGSPTFRAEMLGEVDTKGCALRTTTFLPTFQKHANALCYGVQVHITNRDLFRSFDLYARCIAAASKYDDGFRYRTERYEYVDHLPAIDLLTGSAEFRTCASNTSALNDWLQEQQKVADHFHERREPHLLYRP